MKHNKTVTIALPTYLNGVGTSLIYLANLPQQPQSAEFHVCQGDVPLSTRRTHYCLIVVTALVALRLVVGWHFYKEGAKKLRDQDTAPFTAAPVFAAAKGPLAPLYHGLVADPDGLKRLNYTDRDEPGDRIDVEQTIGAWEAYRQQVGEHYAFGDPQAQDELKKRRSDTKASIDALRAKIKAASTSNGGERSPDAAKAIENDEKNLAYLIETYQQDEQRILKLRGQDEQAKAVLERWKDRLKIFFSDNREEINKYFQGLQRREKNADDPVRQEVASLSGQAAEIAANLKKDRGPWLAEIDAMWTGVEQDLNDVATDEQQSRQGYLELSKPDRKGRTLSIVDAVIPWFDFLVGALLVLGLFTRPAAIAGALLLLGVVATQPPWVNGTIDTYYQTVELFALLVLAATGAGRWAGLDFFIRCLRYKCCPPRTQTVALTPIRSEMPVEAQVISIEPQSSPASSAEHE